MLYSLLLLVVALPSRAETFILPANGDAVIGDIDLVTAKEHDTFADIARRYGLGFEELVLANPNVDPWLPGGGTIVQLPSQYILPAAKRIGIVLNVPEMRLYYFPEEKINGNKIVVTYPVSIGRAQWTTPLGETSVVRKVSQPSWYPPESIRREYAERGEVLPKRVMPGSDNPLGEYALYLGLNGYLIHGTNKPYGIGMRVTHGCVRLYPENIEELYKRLPLGTEVNIVNQPYKSGYKNGVLFVEAHPPLSEAKQQITGRHTLAIRTLVKVSGDKQLDIDWQKLRNIVNRSDGVVTMLSSGKFQASESLPLLK